MKILSKNDALKLIDSRFHDKVIDTTLISSEINAREIDFSKRVDILLKIELIRAYSTCDNDLFEYYKKLYFETISLFTDNTFIEPGDTNKKSPSDYISIFTDLYDRVEKDGFNFSIGAIPFSGGTPLDGAHRIAIAYLLNANISIIDIGSSSVDYGVNYFSHKGASDSLISELVSLLVKYDNNIRTAIIWPAAKIDLKTVVNSFGDTYLFGKRLSLNENGVNNLCVSAYKNEPWVGNDKNNWYGAKGKSTYCYAENDTTIIIFKPSYKGQDLEIKDKIRSLCGGTKHCIHSTDYNKDTFEIVSCTFPVHSEKYLNAINLKEISKLRKYLFEKCMANHIITGSSFMGVLGIRNSFDVDTISLDQKGDHNIYKHMFSKKIESLFSIGACYYEFLDLKFLSLEETLLFKKQRSEKKDIEDIKLINIFLSTKTKRFYDLILILKTRLRQKARRIKNFLIHNLIFVLKKMYLYTIVKRVYGKINS
ncbi:hypothetical protein PY199_002466 [Vibrio cholerae]|nr:hypothetical protein [Vibrio cholerae]EGR5448048.1 hypothetical protein [Vibrio cholerae]EGR5456045.1 hypothetical protein [Vibrio cholerae]EKN8282689.1 hypothetical protein [Vibrio cholerae]BCN20961.1 hypothetical protein [Vibrio cholerae]